MRLCIVLYHWLCTTPFAPVHQLPEYAQHHVRLRVVLYRRAALRVRLLASDVIEGEGTEAAVIVPGLMGLCHHTLQGVWANRGQAWEWWVSVTTLCKGWAQQVRFV